VATVSNASWGSCLKVLAARDEMQWGEAGPPPLLVKIAPDLSKQDLSDIAAVGLLFLWCSLVKMDFLVCFNVTCVCAAQ
jgi:dihydroorotate dehydrogenase